MVVSIVFSLLSGPVLLTQAGACQAKACVMWIILGSLTVDWLELATDKFACQDALDLASTDLRLNC